MAFDEYAAYYDVFYKDKDYVLEAEFVSKKIRALLPQSRSLIEFGCGTGLHAEYLIKTFPAYKGVDLSAGMIEAAKKRHDLSSAKNGLEFRQGDIRDVNFNIEADSLISLFHVFSYQTTKEALTETLKNAKKHLNPGGVLFFDFWYGPAVLEQKPDIRTKEMENDTFKVLRLARPSHDEKKQTVNVHFDIEVEHKKTGEKKNISEDHLMKYFFFEELEYELRNNGFIINEHKEFLTDELPSGKTWGTYITARAAR